MLGSAWLVTAASQQRWAIESRHQLVFELERNQCLLSCLILWQTLTMLDSKSSQKKHVSFFFQYQITLLFTRWITPQWLGEIENSDTYESPSFSIASGKHSVTWLIIFTYSQMWRVGGIVEGTARVHTFQKADAIMHWGWQNCILLQRVLDVCVRQTLW